MSADAGESTPGAAPRSPSPSARRAVPSDAPAIRALLPGADAIAAALEAPDDGRFIIVVAFGGGADPGRLHGAIGADLAGKPTAPETPDILAPAIAPHAAEIPGGVDAAWRALHETLERVAAGAGHRALSVAIPVADAALIKRYESIGYTHTGPGPYRPIGAGQVEYLSGYTDIVGFFLDYGKAL